jgi:putative hemolysin
MSEMALTASRKARLQVMLEAGDSGAQAAIDLHDNPTKFLSVVQVGITSIGILNGIVGDAAFSAPFARWLHATFRIEQRPPTSPPPRWSSCHHLPHDHLRRAGAQALRADVPRVGGALVARPMEWLSLITRPFVKLLSWCTEGTLRLLGMRGNPDRSVTEEEIAASLEEGLDAGVIEAQEHQMVRNVFRLDDRQVGSMMIPRAEIVWLDVAGRRRRAQGHRRRGAFALPGVPRRPRRRGRRHLGADAAAAADAGRAAVAVRGLQPPVFVPETLSGMELLEQFRASSAQLVFVVDEYGEVQGMITVRDVLEAITGEFTTPTDATPGRCSAPTAAGCSTA